MPEETQSDWQETAQQAFENPSAQPGLKDLLTVGCGRRVGDTGNVVVYCQLTQLCSRCDAILFKVSKGQLAGIIQSLQKQVVKQQEIIAHRTNNPRPRYVKPYQSPRRSS